MSHWKPQERAGVSRCRAAACLTGEGDEAFQILDDGAQSELTLYSSQTPPSSSRESMLVLAFGEEMLTSDT